MTIAQSVRGTAVALALVGCCCPPFAFSAETASPAAVTEVRLAEGRALVGQVVDAQNTPRAGLPIVLLQQSRQVAATTTTDGGYFAFRNVRAGQYTLATADGQMPCRVWAADLAPPSAQPALLLISDSRTVLGQNGRPVAGGLRSALANPLVVGGIIATAIVVPVAIHAANDDDEPTSR